MGDAVKIQFICPAEKAVIGVLDVAPGEVVTAQMIREYMDGGPGRRDDARVLRDTVEDRHYLMCPRCDSMLVVGLEGQPVETVVADRFVALVGAFRYPDPQHPHSER